MSLLQYLHTKIREARASRERTRSRPKDSNRPRNRRRRRSREDPFCPLQFWKYRTILAWRYVTGTRCFTRRRSLEAIKCLLLRAWRKVSWFVDRILHGSDEDPLKRTWRRISRVVERILNSSDEGLVFWGIQILLILVNGAPLLKPLWAVLRVVGELLAHLRWEELIFLGVLLGEVSGLWVWQEVSGPVVVEDSEEQPEQMKQTKQMEQMEQMKQTGQTEQTDVTGNFADSTDVISSVTDSTESSEVGCPLGIRRRF